MTAGLHGGRSRFEAEEGRGDLRRYLLGQMSEAEEAAVERAYLGSDEALEELRAREDELIEEYLAGGLEGAERERFERLFLASPLRIERLVFLRALMDRAAKAPLARAGPGRFSLAWRVAAGLAVAVGAGLLVMRTSKPSATTSPASPPAAGPASPAPAVGAPRRVVLQLEVPAVREEENVPLLDLGDADEAVLEVPLHARDAFTAHRGRVAAPDGTDAFASPWQPSRSVLRVVVPSSALRDGRHVLVVEGRAGTGEETVGSYAFRVRRR